MFNFRFLSSEQNHNYTTVRKHSYSRCPGTSVVSVIINGYVHVSGFMNMSIEAYSLSVKHEQNNLIVLTIFLEKQYDLRSTIARCVKTLIINIQNTFNEKRKL